MAKKIFISIGAAVFLCVLITTTVRGHEIEEEEIALPGAGILPSNPLFFIDRFIERLQLFAARDLQRIELREKIVLERLSELRSLAEKKARKASIERAQRYWEEAFQAVEAQLRNLEEQGFEVERWDERILSLSHRSHEVLERVEGQVPEEAKEGIKRALIVSSQGIERHSEAIQKRIDRGEELPDAVRDLLDEARETLWEEHQKEEELSKAPPVKAPQDKTSETPGNVSQPESPGKSSEKSEKSTQSKPSSDKSSNQSSKQSLQQPPQKPKVFSIIAKQWAFEPNIIRVKKGEHVILKIKSVDVTHGFGFVEGLPGIGGPLRPNKEATIEFDALEVGEFAFRCTIFCGSGHPAMTGKLIVEE